MNYAGFEYLILEAIPFQQYKSISFCLISDRGRNKEIQKIAREACFEARVRCAVEAFEPVKSFVVDDIFPVLF